MDSYYGGSSGQAGAPFSDYRNANDLRSSPLSKSSEEFFQLSYLLKLALRAASPNVLNIWQVGNPHLSLQFENRAQGLLQLDSWLDSQHLGDNNSLQDVCQRGFKFPPKGMIFPTGALVLPQATSSGKRTYEVLMCRMAVGRTYAIKESEMSNLPELPPNHHSYYLHKDEDDEEDETEKPYFHEYLLLDSSQVLPVYLIQFEYDPEDDAKHQMTLCDNCENQVATVYCQQDNAKLCYDCDQLTHSANKLVARHIRVPVTERPSSFGYCHEHPKQLVDYFDPIDNVPVCIHCKMSGSHSVGDAATHKLVPIADAYRQAIIAAQKDDTALDSRRQAVQQQLHQLDDRLRAVRNNSKEVEDALFAMMQQALVQLQEITQRKLNSLLGEELELRRQIQHIDWTESFLRYEQQVQDPVDFLHAWRAHAHVRSGLVQLSHPKYYTEIQPDLRIQGQVSIATDDFNSMRAVSFQQASQQNVGSSSQQSMFSGAVGGSHGFFASTHSQSSQPANQPSTASSSSFNLMNQTQPAPSNSGVHSPRDTTTTTTNIITSSSSNNMNSITSSFQDRFRTGLMSQQPSSASVTTNFNDTLAPSRGNQPPQDLSPYKPPSSAVSATGGRSSMSFRRTNIAEGDEDAAPYIPVKR